MVEPVLEDLQDPYDRDAVGGRKLHEDRCRREPVPILPYSPRGRSAVDFEADEAACRRRLALLVEKARATYSSNRADTARRQPGKKK